MGTYSFTTFKANLKFELANRGEWDAYYGDWVNAAYLDFCTRDTFWQLKIPKKYCFPELSRIDTSRATSDGSKYVLVPTDALYIIGIKDTTSDHKLDKITTREYIGTTGLDDSGQEGPPKKWTRIHNKLYLKPTSDAIYALEIYYFRRVAPLSAATDVTEIDPVWDEPILKLAVIQSMMRIKQYEMATFETRSWLEMMTEKIGVYDKEDLDNKSPLAPSYTYKVIGRRPK